MRQCFSSNCNNGKETEWIDDGTEEGYTITTVYDCLVCDGTGMVEDQCYCNARSERDYCCDYDWDKEEICE